MFQFVKNFHNITREIAVRYIRSIFCIVLSIVAINAYAYDPLRGLHGGQIVKGQAYSTFDVFTTHGSHASPNSVTRLESGEIGLAFFNPTVFFQYKDVGNIVDDIETITEKADDDINYSEGLELVNDLKEATDKLSGKGTVVSGLVSGSGIIPSVTWTSEKIAGSFSFDYQSTFGSIFPYAFAASVTGSNNITLDDSDPGCRDGSNIESCKITSDLALNLSVVKDFANYSFGYSRQVLKHKDDNPFLDGFLVVGGKANYFSLTTGYASFQATSSADENSLDDFLEEAKGNTKSTAGVDFDLGVNWVASRYVVGASLGNILTPEIQFKGGEKVKPGIPLTVHGTFQFVPGSDNWGVSLSQDLTGHKDPVGVEYQWTALSVGYGSTSWLIPGVEVGFRKNSGKNGVSYFTSAVKLFQILRVTAAISNDDVNGVPRSAAVGINVGATF